jgi:hypothetical protein
MGRFETVFATEFVQNSGTLAIWWTAWRILQSKEKGVLEEEFIPRE